MEHVEVRLQNIPIGLGDVVACFATVGCGELERPMDKCVDVCEVEPFLKGT
jgi:hypothetical protein